MGGLGLGLMYVPAVTAVGYWFEKKRSLVTGEMSELFYLQRFAKKKSETLGDITTASRPTKVYGWKFTYHGWISNYYLEYQPLVGKPTTLWLEILPSSQPHRYHNSALYILFDKGKVEENSTS